MVDLARFIEEEYEEMKYSGIFIEPDKYFKVEKVLDKLKKRPLSLNIKELDRFRYKEELSKILSDIPFDRLYSEFDYDFLFWIWSNVPFSEEKDKFSANLVDNFNIDRSDLMASLIYTMYEKRGIYSESVISTYDLLNFSKFNSNIIHIEDIISKNLKIKCSPERRDLLISDFGIFPMFRENGGYNIDRLFNDFFDIKTGQSYTIGLDGLAGMALTYRGSPCAVTSYYSPEKNMMMIMQFQGVRPNIKVKKKDYSGKEISCDKEICLKELNYVDWGKILLDIDLEIAKGMDYKKIGIISYKNHPFYGYDKFGRKHLTDEKGMKRYDLFAEQNGFLQKKDRNWYKNL